MTELFSLFQDSYDRALKVISTHKTEVQRLVDALMKYETINGADFDKVLSGKPFSPEVKPKKQKITPEISDNNTVKPPATEPNVS